MHGYIWVSAWKFFSGDFQCCNLAKVNILCSAKRSDLIGINCICIFGLVFAFVCSCELYHMLRTSLLAINYMHIWGDQFLYTSSYMGNTTFENERSYVNFPRYISERYIFASKNIFAHSLKTFRIMIKITANWFLYFYVVIYLCFLDIYFYSLLYPTFVNFIRLWILKR